MHYDAPPHLVFPSPGHVGSLEQGLLLDGLVIVNWKGLITIKGSVAPHEMVDFPRNRVIDRASRWSSASGQPTVQTDSGNLAVKPRSQSATLACPT